MFSINFICLKPNLIISDYSSTPSQTSSTNKIVLWLAAGKSYIYIIIIVTIVMLWLSDWNTGGVRRKMANPHHSWICLTWRYWPWMQELLHVVDKWLTGIANLIIVRQYCWNVWLREINTNFFRQNRACVYFKWGKTLPFISRYEEIHADVFITIFNNSC